MRTITGTIPTEGIKRCYVDGAIVEAKCPKCGNRLEADLEGQYLSYPIPGQQQEVGFYCQQCEGEGVEEPEYVIPIKVISAVLVLEYNSEDIKPV